MSDVETDLDDVDDNINNVTINKSLSPTSSSSATTPKPLNNKHNSNYSDFSSTSTSTSSTQTNVSIHDHVPLSPPPPSSVSPPNKPPSMQQQQQSSTSTGTGTGINTHRLRRLSTFTGNQNKMNNRPISMPYPPSSSTSPAPHNLNNPTSSDITNPAPKINLRRGSTFYNNNNNQTNTNSQITNNLTSTSATASTTTTTTANVPRLRRGSTILPVRPANLTATSASLQQQQQPTPPRLRRGTTIIQKPKLDGDNDNNKNNTNPMASASTSSTTGRPSPSRILKGPGATGTGTFLNPGGTMLNVNPYQQSSPLPRADTFAFGARPGSLPLSAVTKGTLSTNMANHMGNNRASVRLSTSRPPINEGDKVMDHEENERDGEIDKSKTCGMCGNCQTGIKSLPPWAPERLKEMSADEKASVLAEFRAKERLGELDRELREEKLKRQQQGDTPNKISRRSRRNKIESDGLKRTDDVTLRNGRKPNTTGNGQVMDDDIDVEIDGVVTDDLDDDDVDDDVDVDDDADDDVQVEIKERRGRGTERPKDIIIEVNEGDDSNKDKGEDDCGMCDDLELKVESLEQQLDVLREVVKLCSHNEAELQKERAEADKSLKRSKTWMGRITNPFQNSVNAAAAAERSKLKEEVDVLRKATDFLFQKLEETS